MTVVFLSRVFHKAYMNWSTEERFDLCKKQKEENRDEEETNCAYYTWNSYLGIGYCVACVSTVN
jgi:hypothetical protein